MWVPDDFGQDAQLPIVVRAMGLSSAGFQRVPGANLNEANTPPPAPGSPLALLQSIGRDFVWSASDGSTILAHFMDLGYGEGNGALDRAPSDQLWQGVYNMIQDNNASPSPLIFSPLDNDFTLPYQKEGKDALDIINEYNSQRSSSDPVAILATFDDFIQDQTNYFAYLQNVPASSFAPHPYWSGCYGTRPQIKQLHYGATRAVLSAEALELFLELLAVWEPSRWAPVAAAAREAIAGAWTALLPSTHHDYITGTSDQPVCDSDQLSEDKTALYSLKTAYRLATTAQTQVTGAIAGAIPLQSGAIATAGIFNSLGFARENEVALLSGAPSNVQSATMDGTNFDFVQPTSNGLLVMSGAPPLGYASLSLSSQPATRTWNLSLTTVSDGYVMENDALSAHVTLAGITELYDLGRDPQKQTNLVTGAANQLIWFLDDGSLYEFGFEVFRMLDPTTSRPAFRPSATQPSRELPAMTIVDNGPLLKRVSFTFYVDDANAVAVTQFTQTYSLYAGDNMLRMESTGAAPGSPAMGFSIMAAFPMSTPAASLTFGTPHHWDTRAPRAYFQDWPKAWMTDVTFEPAHNFVVANDANGNPIAAFYHFSTPAWGIVNRDDMLATGTILNCLLRDTPNGHRGANGVDRAPHTLSYAIRLPGAGANQLQPPAAGVAIGGPLREALAFNNSLATAVVPATTTSELPSLMELAASVDPPACITAAKIGAYDPTEVVFRVYQPTNKPLTTQISVDSRFASLFQKDGQLNATAKSALEDAPDPGSVVTPAETWFYLAMNYALSTVVLSRSSAGGGCE